MSQPKACPECGHCHQAWESCGPARTAGEIRQQMLHRVCFVKIEPTISWEVPPVIFEELAGTIQDQVDRWRALESGGQP